MRLFSIPSVAISFLLSTTALSADVAIVVPDGFTAEVVATGLGRARHIAVRDNGDIYVALNNNERRRGVAALRDRNGDGVYDQKKRFGHQGGTGIAIYDGYLYFSSNEEVFRMKFDGDDLIPKYLETVVDGFPRQRSHAAKSIAISDEGRLFVNSGAPSNACQAMGRTPGSPGLQPCPQLERSGAIWVFDATALKQDQVDDGERFATGIRNAVALTWDPVSQQPYLVMHGRDQLDTLWPKDFTAAQREQLPAEEFHILAQNTNIGWPYTYYDGLRGERMVGPEYGGDGETVSDNDDYAEPLAAFPAHWAPNAVAFYDSDQFPERYRGGAFVAFHGSWNRSPGLQGGFQVVFQPMSDGQATGEWEAFADGFAGTDQIRSSGDAKHRPSGLAVGPDGSLFISDDTSGTLWRVSYSEPE